MIQGVQDLSTWQNVALVASPALAAIAAGASWASVIQNRKIASAATLPDLVVQGLVNTTTGTVSVKIHNAGPGAARGLLFMIAHNGYLASRYAGAGILRADEMVHIETAIPADSKPEHERRIDAMVACRDRDAFVHIWTNYERHVVRRRGLVRRRPVYEIDMRNEFHRQFPDVDTTKLKPAGAAPSPPTR